MTKPKQISKCVVCGKESKEENIIEKVCTTNCGADVIAFCNKCYNLEYGNEKE